MSRRGGNRQPESRRPQPPVPSQPSPAGRGRGRGRGEPFAVPPPSYGRGETSGAVLPSHGRGLGQSHVAAPAPASSLLSPVPPVLSAPVADISSSSSSTAVESLTSAVDKQLTLQTPEAPLPSSMKAVRFPDRPGFGTVGRKIQVRTNHFRVQVAQQDLYHYDVTISPDISSKARSREVIGALVDAYRESMLGNRLPAYDGRKGLFTAGPLPFDSKEFVIKLGNDEARSSSDTARRKREKEFKVSIKFASKTDIHHLNQFLARRQLDCPQETIQALDIVLRTSPSEMYEVIGRSFFSTSFGETGSLGGGIEYWRGYYQSLRPTQMGLSLNIDVSARAFYEAIPVLDFINQNFRLNLNRPLSDQDRVKIRKALKGVKVEVNHGRTLRRYKVAGVTRESLKDLQFSLDDNRTKTSVVQYFAEKYNISLKYGVLPALQTGSDTKPVYLPIELCHIVAGQRYTKRLNEEQVSRLLKATCRRPHEREDQIKEVLTECNINTDKFARTFGIQVNQDPMLVGARILPPPKLKYHDSGKQKGAEPHMGQWTMVDKKMVRGGTVQYWCLLNLSGRTSRELASRFCIQLINMCIKKGMDFNPEPLLPAIHCQPAQTDNVLRDICKQCATKLANMQVQGRLQLLIIILPDVKNFYQKIKRICETELGIVSQCCLPNKVLKNADRNGQTYFENLALKINVKVGGSNTVLNDAFQRRIPRVSDMPTIIMGADVTHPPPGEDSSPSIAAVVASMDWPYITKYRGIVSAQAHREEIIQDLYTTYKDPTRGNVQSGIIREVLKSFRRITGHKAYRIIFYRDGVSEGQFSQVLLHEVDAIRRASSSLEEGYLPRITFVVVQKRHHTRFFPGSRDSSDRSGNVMPGTVVDTTICHPREFDFFLNSHAGIQGTSRPTHYHVLYDENNFTADELQTFTNDLCYTYARCTRSVSIVPPAYYAHLAAFRARYYIDNEASEADSGGGNRTMNFEVRLPEVAENVKDGMFFC